MTRSPVSLDALQARIAGLLNADLPDQAELAASADDMLAALAETAPPVAPPEGLFDKIEAQLDQDAANPIVTRRADEGSWIEISPGVWMKTLSRGAKGGRMFLLRCEAGAVIPGHHHDHDEHVFVLDGSYVARGVTIRTGDSQFAPGGTDHPDLHSPEGCLLLLYG